jgi:hypothetical protein
VCFPPRRGGGVYLQSSSPSYVTPRLLLKAELLCICAIPWISR